MKNVKFYLPALVLLGTFVFVFQNCKKDTVQPDWSMQNCLMTQQEFLEQIHDFLSLAEELRLGKSSVSRESIPVDSAIFYIDACFNYAYCFHNERFSNSYADTAVIFLSISDGQNVFYDDVLTAFNNAVDSVSLFYHSLPYEDKKLTAFLIENTTQTGNRLEISIVSYTGSGTPPQNSICQNGHFIHEDEYLYRKGSSKCDGSNDGVGAPDILQSEIEFKYLPAPPPGYRFWYHTTVPYTPDLQEFQLDNTLDNYCDFRIFYASEDYGNISFVTECLDYDQDGSGIHEMDFYLEHAEYILNNWLENKNPEGRSFQECTFNHHESENPPLVIQHKQEYKFGFKLLAMKENKYPLIIQ